MLYSKETNRNNAKDDEIIIISQSYTIIVSGGDLFFEVPTYGTNIIRLPLFSRRYRTL